MSGKRDHGGGLDAAIAANGGTRADWLDLSTGINPVPYPVGEIAVDAWTALPDAGAMDRLLSAARSFWHVPDGAEILAAPGASALIARMPDLVDASGAYIPSPTYNEHAAAFASRGRLGDVNDPGNAVHVYVHPNNPDGRLWPADAIGGRPLTVIDESFCEVLPDASHIGLCDQPGVVVLKSFGKFWGLAGLRLGFLIGAPDLLARMADYLGPWAVSGPALEIGARALSDRDWAEATRARLADDAARLDALMAHHGAFVGGTDLFRLFDVGDAAAFQSRLTDARVLVRIFPYSDRWVRVGLPAPERWGQLEAAL